MAIKHKAQQTRAKPKPMKPLLETRGVWSTAYVNDLPDSAFAAISPDGERHLPYKDKTGKVDLPHLRNALARLDQTAISPELKAQARKRLEAAARANGVGDYDTEEPERMTTPTDFSPLADTPTDPHLLQRDAEALLRQIATENGYDLDIQFRAKKPMPAEEDEPEDDEEESGDDPAEDEEDAENAERADNPQTLLREAEALTRQLAAASGYDAEIILRAQPSAPEDDAPLTRAATASLIRNPVQELAYIPITRMDVEKREIEGVLSDEQVDTFGTIFDYDAMKRAVQERWHGNLREQHDTKRAVGRGLHASFDDDKRQVTIRAMISHSADGDNTWTKIQEGILTGFSVGATNAKTQTRMVGGKAVPCFTDFGLAEVSVVDAPSNPGAAASGLVLYRAAGVADGDEEYYAPELDAAVEAETPPNGAPVVAVAPSGADPLADLLTGDPVIDAQLRAEAAAITRDINTTSGLTGYDQGGGAPMPPAPAGIDHAGIEAAMNQERGHAHTPHSHPYDGSTVHENDHPHDHPDGTAAHGHRHMHAHSGLGDGSKPHVHLHEHDHQYSRAASDLASGVTNTVRPGAFLGQDDPRVADYLPRAVAAAPEPAPVPVKPAPNRVAAADAPPATVTPIRAQAPEESRVGMRISGDTASGLHEAVDQILRTCGCNRCQMLLAVIDPDQDGDDDTDSELDTDGDMAPMSRAQQAILQRRVQETVERVAAAEIQRSLAPLTQQFRSLAARFAATPTAPTAVQLDQEDRASIATIKDLVQRIAAQDAPGPMVRAVGGETATPQVPANLHFSPAQLQWMRQQNLLHSPTADTMTRQATDLIRAQLGG